MFYKLKDRYVLRGWDRLPYAVVDTTTGYARFVDRAGFNGLQLCNGRIDCDLPLISKRDRNAVLRLAEGGLVEPCEEPSSISPEQEYRRYPSRYIRQVHWSITGRCNYRCKHCYMSAPHAKYGELDHATVMRIVDEFAECGVMGVSLTGGEPLVRSDFLEIVDALTERGVRITQIYSNGRLVNEGLLKALDARGLHPEFNMSYDAPGWHDWLRGIDGAEEAVDAAFALCREYGFPTGAELCLHEHNKHLLRESVIHLASLGCRGVKVNPVGDVGEWKKNGFGRSMTTAELYELYLAYIPQYYEDGMPLQLHLGGFFLASPRRPDHYDIPLAKTPRDPARTCLCDHARQVMYLSAEGRALPCMSVSGMDVQEEFPLVTEIGFAQCLTDSRYLSFIDTRASAYLELHPECQACAYAPWCLGGCRASALEYSDGADLMGRDPLSCELLRGGYARRIIELMQTVRAEASCAPALAPLATL